MTDQNKSTERKSLEDLWRAHEETMSAIRERLAEDGTTIEINIIIRDKATSERRAKRMARKTR